MPILTPARPGAPMKTEQVPMTPVSVVNRPSGFQTQRRLREARLNNGSTDANGVGVQDEMEVGSTPNGGF